ncbi:hypothetical protein CsSME_00052877 [Camellia sinensis var. sinensis]
MRALFSQKFIKYTDRYLISKTRLVSLKSNHFFHSSQISKENEDTVRQITSILTHNNWQFLLESSYLPQKLNPDVIRSVLHQNMAGDPKRLLGFFNWSSHQMGTPQNLNSFSILAIVLCNSNQFAYANWVLERMIEICCPVSAVLDSIVSCCREFNSSQSVHVVFDVLINAYKKKGMLHEAASLFLAAKNCEFLPSLVCCNSLLKDLLKCNRMELFWSVYYAMLEAKINPDVYTLTSLISAHCKVGNVREGQRVLLEMEEKGCSPNLVTYNVTIGGLCKAGLVDEALELKKSMTEKGLAPDGYTYSILIDGFCKQKRSREAKFILGEMSNVGLNSDHVVYTALIDGFMKEGDVEEAFRIKDEIVARGKKLNIITCNVIINGLCKVR